VVPYWTHCWGSLAASQAINCARGDAHPH